MMARLLPYFAMVHLALVPVLCSARAPARGIPKICSASDPELNLSNYDPVDPQYYVSNDRQLERICDCTEIDYFIIGDLIGCDSCKQDTLDACRLESITGKDPSYGFSLVITQSPLITSLRGLGDLRGALLGSLTVSIMQNITTLEGLSGITSIKSGDTYGTKIEIIGNPKLTSATALSNIKENFTSAVLDIDTAQLGCVPEQWPAKDKHGAIIRRGPCPANAVY